MYGLFFLVKESVESGLVLSQLDGHAYCTSIRQVTGAYGNHSKIFGWSMDLICWVEEEVNALEGQIVFGFDKSGVLGGRRQHQRGGGGYSVASRVHNW